MHIYVQWATATPSDWFTIDLASNPNAWRQLAKKSEPAFDPDPTLDDAPGWVFAINCQGIVWSWCERTSIEVVSNALVISNEYTNPAYYPAGWRYAQVWTLNNVRSDARFGGRANTDQRTTYYAEPEFLAFLQSLGPLENTTLATYASYKRPNQLNTKFGPDMSQTQADALVAAQTFHGWQEWDHSV